MNILTFNKIKFVLIILFSPFFLFLACSSDRSAAKLVITIAPSTAEACNFVNGTSWRFRPQSRIAILNGKAIKVLTDDFFSAAFPDISYDGKKMIFAGQKKKEDRWSIWEMDLSGTKATEITTAGGDCIDPVYLPAGRFAFSMHQENDSLKSGFSLYTGNLDGTNISRITFNPAAFFASNVLADGRIISAGRRVYPDTGAQRLMVMRPDGTKAELFFLPVEGLKVTGRPRETPDGKLVFIETAEGTGKNGRLSSVRYNRPLHSYSTVPSATEGDFNSVFPLADGKYLVSFRKSAGEKYGLYNFDPAKNNVGEKLYGNDELDVIDVAVAEVHQRPKKLPSEVDKHVKTGLLMCQDINFLNPAEKTMNRKKAVKIELLGIGKSLGTINVEPDGSFLIKPLADSPFRIQTLDENGNVINGPGSWLYLRPNERRGCVGCHEDMEMTPENRVAMAVKKKPVIFPVHIVKIKEKKVELE